MNIYQKKIFKESELFFLDDLVQQGKNNNKNQKTNICKEFQPNLNIRKFYGLSSKLLKKDSEKNNRQLRSKSQIFSSSPLIENIIPKEIKTIIIKLHNQKEQKESEKNNKNNFKTFSDNKFQEAHMSTIGLDYRLKNMILKSGKNVKLQIWDTAGQDRFRAITKNYYKSANGIILIYDVTSLPTYENVKNWITQIREEASQNVVIYIAGNKIDMEEERKIKTEEGQKLADEYGFPFIETSAKNGINIDKTFEDLVEKIDSVYSKLETNSGGNKINKVYTGKKKGCC